MEIVISPCAARFLPSFTVLALLAATWAASPALAQGDAADADGKFISILIKPRCKPVPGLLRVPCQYKKIQPAINAAVNGDKILVNAGVYKGNNNANLLIAGKSIILECKGAPGSCVIDAEESGRALNLAVTASLIRGFKFINGETSSSNPPAAQGGAVYSSNSAAVFDQCIFEGNEAVGFNSAGGAYSSFSSSDSIINSLLVNNIADIGSAIHLSGGGSMLLRNSTVSANVAGGNFLGAITVNQINTALDIRSSIVWGNLPAQNEVINNSGLVDANYSIVPADVLPSLGGTGSTSFDPQFTNPAAGDYRPNVNVFPPSPAINNGDPNFIAFGGENDLDDSCRKWCGQIDIGAYEDATCTNFQQWPATDTPLAIPDGDPAGVESDVFVSGFGTITVTGVYVSLSHPSLSQLRVYLVAPDGTEDQLCSGCFSQFYTVTNDFLGKGIHGTWTLRVEDPFTGSVGTLEDWRLDFEYTTPSCQQ